MTSNTYLVKWTFSLTVLIVFAAEINLDYEVEPSPQFYCMVKHGLCRIIPNSVLFLWPLPMANVHQIKDAVSVIQQACH